ncbi:MAG: hypothetical protein QXT84_04160, partial [Candidatus Bathyarchaeia archaeon]
IFIALLATRHVSAGIAFFVYVVWGVFMLWLFAGMPGTSIPYTTVMGYGVLLIIPTFILWIAFTLKIFGARKISSEHPFRDNDSHSHEQYEAASNRSMEKWDNYLAWRQRERGWELESERQKRLEEASQRQREMNEQWERQWEQKREMEQQEWQRQQER